MSEVLRQEKKFLLSLDEYYKFKNYVSGIISPDSHNGRSGYMVRSLYFDSLNDRDYFGKLDGTEVRRKIRLRIYHPGDADVFLEVKQKQGMYQKKRGLRIKREEACAMIRGDYSSLRAYKDPLAAECYGIMNMYCYRPKTIIEYEREAYIVPANNTRITFDKNLYATEGCYDIFSEQLNMYPVTYSSYVILEVKYLDYLLSYVNDIIAACDKTEISVSKYLLGRGLNTGI